MIDPQNLDQLQEAINAMQWDTVQLEPDAADVQALDQQLPAEWLATREDERTFDQDVLEPLAAMSDQELQNTLDIPEGNINQNAHEAIQELGLDIDSLLRDLQDRERELGTETPTIDQDSDLHRDDFGR